MIQSVIETIDWPNEAKFQEFEHETMHVMPSVEAYDKN